jgi:hypothetical protein
MGGTCPSAVNFQEYSDTSCSSAPFPQAAVSGCLVPQFGGSFSAAPNQAAGAQCTGPAPIPTPPVFGEFAQGCSGGVVGSCSGGVCVTPASHVCVYQNGQSPCPPPFPNQTIVYQGTNNGTICSQCTCGVAVNPTCEAIVTAYTDMACTQNPLGVLTNGTCTTAPGGAAQSISLTNPGIPTGGMCSAFGTAFLLGNPMPTNPVTVCCAM